jgi:thioredoxin-dependent peroxiredoxin
MSVDVGDLAPEFTLPGTGGRSYALSEFRGHSVLLAFYPGDNSPVCTVQLNEYSREIGEFEDVDAQVLAISPQGVDSHESFSEKQGGFAFPLLADTEKEVGRAYGILGPLGFYRRSVFVVDPKGVIRYAHRSATGLTFKKTSDLIAALEASSSKSNHQKPTHTE